MPLTLSYPKMLICSECECIIGEDKLDDILIGTIFALKKDGFKENRAFCGKRKFDSFYEKHPEEHPDKQGGIDMKKVYRVEVKTTNGLRDTTHGPELHSYRDCNKGEIYVITDDPRKIYDEFPWTKSIEEIGVGYTL